MVVEGWIQQGWSSQGVASRPDPAYTLPSSWCSEHTSQSSFRMDIPLHEHCKLPNFSQFTFKFKNLYKYCLTLVTAGLVGVFVPVGFNICERMYKGSIFKILNEIQRDE